MLAFNDLQEGDVLQYSRTDIKMIILKKDNYGIQYLEGSNVYLCNHITFNNFNTNNVNELIKIYNNTKCLECLVNSTCNKKLNAKDCFEELLK